MAFRSYLRLGYATATLVATLCTTAPSYATGDQTYAATGDYGYGYSIVISYNDHANAFDLAPLALIKEQPAAVTQRGYQAFKPLSIKERASGAAVRPTSVAGWRSGRTRHLAA